MINNKIKIQLLKIANDLAKTDKLEEYVPGDYKIPNIMSKYIGLYRSFKEVDESLTNESSEALP